MQTICKTFFYLEELGRVAEKQEKIMKKFFLELYPNIHPSPSEHLDYLDEHLEKKVKHIIENCYTNLSFFSTKCNIEISSNMNNAYNLSKWNETNYKPVPYLFGEDHTPQFTIKVRIEELGQETDIPLVNFEVSRTSTKLEAKVLIWEKSSTTIPLIIHHKVIDTTLMYLQEYIRNYQKMIVDKWQKYKTDFNHLIIRCGELQKSIKDNTKEIEKKYIKRINPSATNVPFFECIEYLVGIQEFSILQGFKSLDYALYYHGSLCTLVDFFSSANYSPINPKFRLLSKGSLNCIANCFITKDFLTKLHNTICEMSLDDFLDELANNVFFNDEQIAKLYHNLLSKETEDIDDVPYITYKEERNKVRLNWYESPDINVLLIHLLRRKSNDKFHIIDYNDYIVPSKYLSRVSI